MKQQNLKFVIIVLVALFSINAHAYDAEIDGIYYILNSETQEATVVSAGSGSYSGEVIIPPSFSHGGKVYFVTSIGAKAFSYCNGLISLTMPNSVKIIEECAFDGCTALKSLTISNSLTEIGSSAFRNCSKLTSLTIPNSVYGVGDRLFEGCSGITSPIYNVSSFIYMPQSFVGNYKIPEGITTIYKNAFSEAGGINSVEIPNSVVTIEDGAFAGCGLTSVVIPGRIRTIRGGVFSRCGRLASVTISEGITEIEKRAFYKCSSLTSIVIPNSVKIISEGAFEECSSLTSVTIGNSVEDIHLRAFYGCTGLHQVTIPDNVKTIGPSAFAGCSSLTDLIIPENTHLDGGFSGCAFITPIYTAKDFAYMPPSYMGDYTIPDGITNICGYAFSECQGLTSVTIPEGVTTIGGWAFAGCTGLTSIQLPKSITDLGDKPFIGCTGLTSPVYTSSEFIYMPKSHEGGYRIPEGITTLCLEAFTGCSKLTSIDIPSSVKFIDMTWNQFGGCENLRSIRVDSGNTVYDSRNNCNAIIETATNKLIAGCVNTMFPEDITAIGECAFEGCGGLNDVYLPNSVKTIEDGAFAGSGLTSITIPSSVTYIHENAFHDTSAKIIFVNTLVVDNTEIFQGENIVLPVHMNNTDPITAIQFDITLPDGISVAMNAQGKYVVQKMGRCTNHTLNTSKLNGANTYRFLLYSADVDVIDRYNSHDDVLLNVTLNAARGMPNGDYEVRLSNINLTMPNETKITPADVTSKLTVKEVQSGDVNRDGIVDVTDIVCIANYILGKTTGWFDFVTADINNDDSVDVTDIVAVANMIMHNGGSNAAKIRKALDMLDL